MKKKKKKITNKFEPKFIKEFNNDVSVDKLTDRFIDINTNSWFNIKEKDVYIKGEYKSKITFQKLDKVSYSCKKIILKPTDDEKNTILTWMEAFRLVYNYAIFHLRKNNYTFYELRKNMKEIKYKIQTKYPCNIHILDRAIHLAITNKKSALSNLKNGNISQFRLRYWRKNQDNRIVKIEKNEMKNIKLFKTIKNYCEKENINLNEAEAECTIKYNKSLKKFILFYPVKIIDTNKEKSNNKTISLDPGLRTFITGISNDKSIKICDEIKDKLKPILLRIDKYQSVIMNKKKRRYEQKIKDVIDDLHWKSINYLTSHYDNIIIGNMSTKDVIKKEKENKVDNMTKRLLQNMSLYKFKERLKYKCYIKGKSFLEVDESYTSKTCSMCGIIDNDLGSKKEFNCTKCKLKLDRDVNGARNIYLKSLLV